MFYLQHIKEPLGVSILSKLLILLELFLLKDREAVQVKFRSQMFRPNLIGCLLSDVLQLLFAQLYLVNLVLQLRNSLLILLASLLVESLHIFFLFVY